MPGAGGTQRLTRAIGKARAMELILTGRTMTAARGRGGAAWSTRVVPAEATLDAALELAAPDRGHAAARGPCRQGAPSSTPTELPLADGLRREREAFFAVRHRDQTEGMAAFIEKRPPDWTGR